MSLSHKPHHYKKAKAVLNILILFVAILIFLIFVTYKNNVNSSNLLLPFILLTVLGLGLLVGLLYLVSNSSAPKHHLKKNNKSSKRKKHKSR